MISHGDKRGLRDKLITKLVRLSLNLGEHYAYQIQICFKNQFLYIYLKKFMNKNVIQAHVVGIGSVWTSSPIFYFMFLVNNKPCLSFLLSPCLASENYKSCSPEEAAAS
ncbi:hypothetical protein ACJX0J_027481, partial [Zea mays]